MELRQAVKMIGNRIDGNDLHRIIAYAGPESNIDAEYSKAITMIHDVIVSISELNEDLLDILGRPCFSCIRIAQILRRGGVHIKTRAEDEQAHVQFFLLGHYVRDRANWRKNATDELNEMLTSSQAATEVKS